MNICLPEKTLKLLACFTHIPKEHQSASDTLNNLEVNTVIVPKTCNCYTSFVPSSIFCGFSQDDERLRALDDMMGGVLEIRREDVLKMVRCVSAVSFRKLVGSYGNVKFNQQISPTSVTEESWRTVELHYDQIGSIRPYTKKDHKILLPVYDLPINTCSYHSGIL